jgi:hypothetical protein
MGDHDLSWSHGLSASLFRDPTRATDRATEHGIRRLMDYCRALHKCASRRSKPHSRQSSRVTADARSHNYKPTTTSSRKLVLGIHSTSPHESPPHECTIRPQSSPPGSTKCCASAVNPAGAHGQYTSPTQLQHRYAHLGVGTPEYKGCVFGTPPTSR